MNFQCSKCKSWNTYTKDVYSEGSDGVCFDCHTFYKMGKKEINWKSVINFLTILIIGIIIAYFLGVFK